MKALAWTLAFVTLLTILAAAAPVGGQSPSTWATPVDEDSLPSGPEGRHYRVTVRAEVDMPGVRDLPVQADLDLAAILAAHGHPSEEASGRVVLQGFALDLESFVLFEEDAAGDVSRLPILVLPGSGENSVPFDAERNPSVTARWIMPGETTGPRHFHIYFDALHNDKPPAPSLDAADEVQLATSVGPGRGTTLYVPLHPLTGAQGSGSESRRVRITALHDDTDVSIYEYRGGVPLSEPIQTYAGLSNRQVVEYILGANGNQPSEGSIKVDATRPVLAEALSVSTNQRSSFVSNDFLASRDGGLLGMYFEVTPTAPETWHIFCPRVAAVDLGGGQNGCSFLHNGPAYALPPHGVLTVPVPAGQPSHVAVTAGSVMVHRQGSGMTFWPSADGPRASSEFLGYVGASDQLLLTAVEDQTCILAQSRAKNSFLADKGSNKLCMDAGGFHDCLCSWGTTMDRRWETRNEHTPGPLRLEAYTGDGLGVVAGPIEHPTNFNSLVVPQSPDGGLTYRIMVPESTTGAALGHIVLFALQDGTGGVASLPDGTTVQIPSLREGERFDLREGAGWWTVTMDRPVVAAWLKTGAVYPFGAFVPGFTDVAEVEVTGADFAGQALQATIQGSSFLQRQPGDLAQFTLDVTNLARDTAGRGLGDTVTVRLEAPDGWSPDVRPATRVLGPGETGSFSLQANVPQTVSGAGASLRAVVTSASNPGLEVDQVLQVSYIIRRGVEVLELESASHGEAQRNIGLEETARYSVRVINKGSAPDSFDLLFSEAPDRWVQTVTPGPAGPDPGAVQDAEANVDHPWFDGDWARTPELMPGEFVDVFLDVTPGAEVNLASKLVTRASATSIADRSVTDSLRAVTIVGVDRSFRVLVESPTRTIDPGASTTFLVLLQNDAEVNEELRVELISALPPGWSDATVRWVEQDASLEEVDNTVRLDALGTATLAVTREVPADAAPLALSIDRLRIQSQFDRDAPATDTTMRVLAATLRGMEATLQVPGGTIEPGKEVPVTLRLSSLGNLDQNIRVTPVLPDASWSVLDENGAAAPWDLLLPSSGTVELEALLQVPPNASPGTNAISFDLGAFGVATRSIAADLEVKELPAVTAQDGVLRIDPGRVVPLDVRIQNVGNIAVDLTGAWSGLPDWDARVEPLRLAPGAQGTLRTWLQVPVDIPFDTLEKATLDVRSAGKGLASATWSLSTNVPRLEATVERVEVIGKDQATYTIQVSNVGLDSAHNVSILLDDQAVGTVDRFGFNQVLPGATQTAVLLGPADSKQVRLRMVADHDPEGVDVPLGDVDVPSVEGRFSPAPTFVPVLVALAAFVASRRWRS